MIKTGALLFENLFVLEAANNHWGDLNRGKKIIQDFDKKLIGSCAYNDKSP
jgi:hypothetical protein